MTRNKDLGIPTDGGRDAAGVRGEAGDVTHAGDSLPVEVGIAREYGQKTLTALGEMVRLSEVAARLVERGHDWYVNDPENVPGLAAEGLIIKIGENCARVSSEFETDHPEIPWPVIKDMRNRLTHYYEATDYAVVWNTIESDFPGINEMVRGLLGRG